MSIYALQWMGEQGDSTFHCSAVNILACSDPAVLDRLVILSKAEGFRHLERLVSEWDQGINRFELDGEALYVVENQGRIVACGGITKQSPTLGRVRRMYVDPAHRRQGVGRKLIEALIQGSRSKFDGLVLFTDNPVAAVFYERLGFMPEDANSNAEHATHRLMFESSLNRD